MPNVKIVYPINVKRQARESRTTYDPKYLFIENISILSDLKMAFMGASQMISFLFEGFCRSFAFMYTQSCLTTCGRDSLSTASSEASGGLAHSRHH